MFSALILSRTIEACHPLLSTPLRFCFGLLPILQLLLRSGSGLVSAALFGSVCMLPFYIIGISDGG